MFDQNKIFARVFLILTSCLSAGSVWANISQQPDLVGLPWIQIGMSGVISLWGGVSRTAEQALVAAKLSRAVPTIDSDFHLINELRRDLFVSSGIGLVIYALAVHSAWDLWTLAAALWLGGYAGTRLVNLAVDSALKRFKNFFGKE